MVQKCRQIEGKEVAEEGQGLLGKHSTSSHTLSKHSTDGSEDDRPTQSLPLGLNYHAHSSLQIFLKVDSDLTLETNPFLNSDGITRLFLLLESGIFLPLSSTRGALLSRDSDEMNLQSPS